MATIDTIANEAYQRHLLKGAEVAPVAVEQKVDSLVKRPPVTEVPEPEVETGKNVIMRFIDALTNDVYDSSILDRAQKEPSTDVQMGSDKMYGRYKTPLHVFQAMNRDVDPDSAEMYVRETPSLDYLNMLDIDAREEEMELQEYRRMVAGDSEFSFPTEARQVSSKIKIPKFAESEDPEVTIKDAPDADIVLDEPTQIETEGLGSRPVMETQTDDGQDLAMPANIDFDFIGQQEGVKSSMYVPKKNGQVLDDSGPTIGIGLDLGQRNVSDLKGLSPELIEKLSPYTGMKGSEADSFVENNPLTLTSDELTEVNAWTKKTETDKLLKRWAEDSDIAWSDLTPQQATVVASVSYQYGASAPKFWSHVTSGDWDAAEAELRDFGDEYKSRRLREARYLAGN